MPINSIHTTKYAKIDYNIQQKLNILIATHSSENKAYGLIWERQSEEIYDALQEKQVSFVCDNTRTQIIEDTDTLGHMLFESDNLAALYALYTTHANTCSIAYCDPPYNTHNNDFIYNDKFVNKSDTYRHSKWLSFMERRLILIRELLNDEGVLFISIDDNEMAQLKLLCDAIFGEANFIACSPRQCKAGSGHDSKHLAVEFDYTLIYAKNIKNLSFSRQVVDVSTDKKYKLTDTHVAERGAYYLRALAYKGSSGRPSKWSVTAPDGTELYSDDNGKVGHEWRWGEKKFAWGVENDFIVFKQVKGVWQVYIKQYQHVDNNNEPRVRTVPYRALMQYLNTAGTQELKRIVPGNTFTYPKPVAFIKHLIALHPDKNAVVVDVFAGSGTTGQAVLECNQEDEGNRRFILCTNNENEICTKVTYPRIKHALDTVNDALDKSDHPTKSNTLFYYRLENTACQKSE